MNQGPIMVFAILLMAKMAVGGWSRERPQLLVNREFLTNALIEGKPSAFVIRVVNTGAESARNVRVSLNTTSSAWKAMYDVSGAAAFRVPLIKPGETVEHIVHVSVKRFPRDREEETAVMDLATAEVVARYSDDDGKEYTASGVYRNGAAPRFASAHDYAKAVTNRADVWLIFAALMAVSFGHAVYPLYCIHQMYDDSVTFVRTVKRTEKNSDRRRANTATSVSDDDDKARKMSSAENSPPTMKPRGRKPRRE